MKKLTLISPDDWHIHLRDDTMLAGTVKAASRYFNRVLVMPNTKQPIINMKLAQSYFNRIMQVVLPTSSFQPLLSLYLHESMTQETIQEAKDSGIVFAVKLYPVGVTTNSSSGVADIQKFYPIFEKMQQVNMPLLIHGESSDVTVDIFDRESVFIEKTLQPLVTQFPELKIVLEHVSTKEGVAFVKQAPSNVAATITVQHMAYNRNQLLEGSLNPHYYCFPILKREEHRKAVFEAAISGSRKFFLGTDSAPHPRSKKESACGCGGIYTGNDPLALYAELFEQAEALDKLENFASYNGALFYELPIQKNTVTLIKEETIVPQSIQLGEDEIIPYRAGEAIQWRTLVEFLDHTL